MSELRDEDYARLLGFRTALRRFLHWSEEKVRAAGLTPTQHQLLLAIRGHSGDAPPTVGELAQYLVLRHHSVVELIDRAAAAGLVTRDRDETDKRIVHARLTPLGDRRIAELSRLHLEELRRLAPPLGLLEEAEQKAAETGQPRRRGT